MTIVDRRAFYIGGGIAFAAAAAGASIWIYIRIREGRGLSGRGKQMIKPINAFEGEEELEEMYSMKASFSSPKNNSTHSKSWKSAHESHRNASSSSTRTPAGLPAVRGPSPSALRQHPPPAATSVTFTLAQPESEFGPLPTSATDLVDLLLQRFGSRLRIRDPSALAAKLAAMQQARPERLQIVSDFDRTLSRYRERNGKKTLSSHGLLESSHELSEESRQKLKQLTETYLPIEMDIKLTPEEKMPHMEEWWSKSHELLVRAGVRESTVRTLVALGGLSLRENADQFLHRLATYTPEPVPVVLLSAGCGNVVVEVLRHIDALFDNVRVLSNFMEFRGGACVGFCGELIHTFNKSYVIVKQSDMYEKLAARDQCLLLGDTLGDLRMVHGATNLTNVVTIGFLNEATPSSGVHVVASSPRGLETMAAGNGSLNGCNGNFHSYPGNNVFAAEGGAHNNGNGHIGNGNGNGNGAAAEAADVASAASSDWADIYAQRYDLVLLADETFNVPLALLDFLLAPLPTDATASALAPSSSSTAPTTISSAL